MSEELTARDDDEIDRLAGTLSTISTDEFMVKIKNCEEPKVGDRYYQMQSDPRGYCLIFNIFEFPNTNYDIRKGSETEAKNLSDIFKELKFITEVFDNPTASKIVSTVDQYSEKPELEDHDSIILIFLSHGKRDGFIGSDGIQISFKDIVDKLNNNNCRKLIDKPKLFFFSCCRGNTTDPGVSLVESLGTTHNDAVSDTVPVSPVEDGPTKFVTKLVPMVSDIMICYSTVDGFVSWRCEETGSWLGSALQKALYKYSHNKDLLSILTEISNVIDERTANGFTPAKQVIEIILRGFKKKFYFNPGYVAKPSLGGKETSV